MKQFKQLFASFALLAVIGLGVYFVPASAQFNPAFGPVNGGPQNNPFVPASPTPAAISYVAPINAPVLNSACYNPVILLVDTQSSNLWICAQVPNTQRTSAGTWRLLAGTGGNLPGSTTLASAATIAPVTSVTVLTGTTAVTAITVPTGLQAGAVLTFITNSATTSDFPTGNNITGTSTGITTVAGQGLRFYFDGTNFHKLG